MKPSTTPRERLAELERKVIKTALARFREWRKLHGKINDLDFHDRKKALAHLKATAALFEAKYGK